MDNKKSSHRKKNQDLKRKVHRILSNPYLLKTSKICNALLMVAANLGQSKNSKLAMFSAAGSLIEIVRGNLGLPHVTVVENYIQENELHTKTFDALEIIWTPEVVAKLGFEVLVYDEVSNFTLFGYDDGVDIFAVTLADGKDCTSERVYFTSSEGNPESGLKKGRDIIANALWLTYGSSGIEVAYRSGTPKLIRLPDKPTHYIGKYDPVAFADEVHHFRSKGINKSVILTGPPGVGKTTFIQSYAELTNSRNMVIGPDAFDVMVAGDVEFLVEVLKPDILLLDDLDKVHNHNITYTMLPNIKRHLPELVVVVTCNNPSALGSAFLRPGRGGEIRQFGYPDTKEKEELLKLYMEVNNVDTSVYDLQVLSELLSENCAHDWVRSVAEQAIVYDTQETMIEFIKDINKKIDFVNGVDDAVSGPTTPSLGLNQYSKMTDKEALRLIDSLEKELGIDIEIEPRAELG